MTGSSLLGRARDKSAASGGIAARCAFPHTRCGGLAAITCRRCSWLTVGRVRIFDSPAADVDHGPLVKLDDDVARFNGEAAQATLGAPRFAHIGRVGKMAAMQTPTPRFAAEPDSL